MLTDREHDWEVDAEVFRYSIITYEQINEDIEILKW